MHDAHSPRILPHSIAAEQSVIGSVMLDNASYLTIAGLLKADDFYRHDHQLIFRALQEMAADNQPLDVITVSEWMKGRLVNPQYPADKRTFFDVIGGLAYLGDLAKDFACPVLLLSQLNRSVENRPNKRPVMSDLRESGALEQDAACVLFIYRDDIYYPDSNAKGMAELIVAKHRGGQTGTIHCAFVGKHQRFANQSEVKQ